MQATAIIKRIAIIGAGPAGLMAAEVLAQHGLHVDVYDAMPSAGRKFLMAGKGGMNITHAEPYADFLARYGARRGQIEPLLKAFTPSDLREWVHGLGIDTFVGSSGRVFPADMKAAPLLRAWLHRLRETGVHFHTRHRWCGWDEDGALRFATPEGEVAASPDATVLALGGGSWPQLGSDGAWIPLLAQRGIDIAALRPSNCGFNVSPNFDNTDTFPPNKESPVKAASAANGIRQQAGSYNKAPTWSAHFRERCVGEPLKSVAATFGAVRKQGECVITSTGIEGGLIYSLSAALRDEIEHSGSATLYLDLLPDWSEQRVHDEVHHPRGSRSQGSHLQSRLGLKGVKSALLREVLGAEGYADSARLAAAIKALPLKLIAPRPLIEAISSAGGVRFEALDERLMLKNMPGVFCAGEMLDWEAPTGGYLLSACFASGRAAGQGVAQWLSVA